MNAQTARILAVLPQTQCTRCGYPDCAAYAEAIAAKHAPINQCPPGGQAGIERLATVSGQAAQPLNPIHGQEGPRKVAYIDEDWCIGCTLCIKACPVDAIVGANQRMHSVLETYCTGCELCLPVCPVDCILLENASGPATGWAAWSEKQATQARKRYEASQRRQTMMARRNQTAQLAKALAKPTGLKDSKAQEAQDRRKRDMIEAALAKARSRQSAG